MLPAFIIVVAKNFPSSFLTNPSVFFNQLANNGTALVPKRNFLFNYTIFYPMRLGSMLWNGAGAKRSLRLVYRVILENIYGWLGKYLGQSSGAAREVFPPAPVPADLGPDDLATLIRESEIKMIALEVFGGAVLDEPYARPDKAQESFLPALHLNHELWNALRKLAKPVMLVGALPETTQRIRELLHKEDFDDMEICGQGSETEADEACYCGSSNISKAEVLYIGPETKAWIDQGSVAFHIPRLYHALDEYGGNAGEYAQFLAERDPAWGMLMHAALRPWLGFGAKFPQNWACDQEFLIRAIIAPVICLAALKNIVKGCIDGKKVSPEAQLYHNVRDIFAEAIQSDKICMISSPEFAKSSLAILKPYDELLRYFLADHRAAWPICLDYAQELATYGNSLPELAKAKLKTCRSMLAYLHEEGALTNSGFFAGLTNQAGKSIERQLDLALEDEGPFAATGFMNISNAIAPHANLHLPEQPCSIGVHLHIHDGSMAQEFARYLRVFPAAFDLWITYSTPAIKNQLHALFDGDILPYMGHAYFREAPNRGRDIAPWLVECGSSCMAYDLFCHIHAKRSAHLHNARGDIWRRYLLDNLLEPRAFAAIAHAFESDRKLGCVFPALFPPLRKSPTTLYGSPEQQRIIEELLKRMGLPGPLTRRELFFPAGTMFWYRPVALKPLFDAGLSYDDFPPEPLPQDGTLAHATERAITLVCMRSGHTVRSLTAWPLAMDEASWQ